MKIFEHRFNLFSIFKRLNCIHISPHACLIRLIDQPLFALRSHQRRIIRRSQNSTYVMISAPKGRGGHRTSDMPIRTHFFSGIPQRTYCLAMLMPPLNKKGPNRRICQGLSYLFPHYHFNSFKKIISGTLSILLTEYQRL